MSKIHDDAKLKRSKRLYQKLVEEVIHDYLPTPEDLNRLIHICETPINEQIEIYNNDRFMTEDKLLERTRTIIFEGFKYTIRLMQP